MPARGVVLGALVALSLAGGSPARAALPVYVEFFDARGSAIAGPVTVRGFEGTTEGLSFFHLWAQEFDPRGGQPAGARLERLELTYPVGPASPLLAAAFARSQHLARVVFHFVRPGNDGRLEDFFRLTVEDLPIVSISTRLPDVLEPANQDRPYEETIALLYKTGHFDWFGIEQVLYLPADSNGDLKFDIADPVRLLGFLFAGEVVRCPLSGDMNGDRTLDISDPIAMLLALFSGGPPPPPPFPACGPQPLDAAIPCGESACNR